MSPPIGIGTATLESGSSSRSKSWPVATRGSVDNSPVAALIAVITTKLAKGCLRNQDNVGPVFIEQSPIPIGVYRAQQSEHVSTEMPATELLRELSRQASGGARRHELLGLRPEISRHHQLVRRDRSPLG